MSERKTDGEFNDRRRAYRFSFVELFAATIVYAALFSVMRLFHLSQSPFVFIPAGMAWGIPFGYLAEGTVGSVKGATLGGFVGFYATIVAFAFY